MQNNEISKWELRKVYCNLLPELRNEIVLHAVQECVYVCVCVVEHFNLAVNLILINTINVTIEVHTHTQQGQQILSPTHLHRRSNYSRKVYNKYLKLSPILYIGRACHICGKQQGNLAFVHSNYVCSICHDKLNNFDLDFSSCEIRKWNLI